MHANFDVIVSVQTDLVKETIYNCTPLSDEGSNKEVVPHRTISILLQEGHQKTKPDVDHNMDILKYCERKQKLSYISEQDSI